MSSLLLLSSHLNYVGPIRRRFIHQPLLGGSKRPLSKINGKELLQELNPGNEKQACRTTERASGAEWALSDAVLSTAPSVVADPQLISQIRDGSRHTVGWVE